MKVVICEKYNQGEVVAETICDGPVKQTQKDEPLWICGDELVVIPLSGQIFEINNVEGRSGYPDFPELEWVVQDRHSSKVDVLTHWYAQADEVVLAGDYDREGELISTLALLIPMWGEADYQHIHDWDVPVTRMKYSSMVPHEIQEAWDNRGEPDEALFEAGVARTLIDYRVGINISKGLSQCVLRGLGDWVTLSAGRVQTPLVSLINDRTEEHRDHDPETYWTPKVEWEP